MGAGSRAGNIVTPPLAQVKQIAQRALSNLRKLVDRDQVRCLGCIVYSIKGFAASLLRSLLITNILILFLLQIFAQAEQTGGQFRRVDFFLVLAKADHVVAFVDRLDGQAQAL
jgi:hypothetical protein